MADVNFVNCIHLTSWDLEITLQLYFQALFTQPLL
jgi:hypothetical protein